MIDQMSPALLAEPIDVIAAGNDSVHNVIVDDNELCAVFDGTDRILMPWSEVEDGAFVWCSAHEARYVYDGTEPVASGIQVPC